MQEAQRLRDAIKARLKARGMRYADLARALDLSEPSVKRLLSRGGITLERLERICEVLETDFYDLARSGKRSAEKAQSLTLAQEEALAADARLLTVFHLLANGWEPHEIQQRFSLSEVALVKLLARLDRLKLLDLQPGNHVRMRVARDFAWRPQGPVLRRWARSAVVDFFRGSFDGEEAFLNLEVRELGPASLALLRRKLEKVVKEFNELAAIDAPMPPARRRGVGLVIGMRPWSSSMVESLREEAGFDEKPVAKRPARPRSSL